jgi:hypothetical protein
LKASLNSHTFCLVHRAATGAIIIGKKVIKLRNFDSEVFNELSSSDDDNDLIARKAFESVLRVSLLQPTSPKFHNFSEIVRSRAANTYNYHFVEGEEVI